MTQAEQLAAQAAQWHAAGRADMAAQLYGAALEHDPSKYAIRMQLAECLVALGQPALAAEHYLMVAQAYAARGGLQECLAICDRVIDIAPQMFVYMSVGPMVRRIGRHARTACAKAAEAHLAAGRQTDGLQLLRLGAELDPQNAEVRLQLARIYLGRHMNREAVEALCDAGNILIQARRYPEYVDVASRILAIEPNELQTLRDLPRVYLELGRPQDAVRMLGQLTRVSPGDIIGYEVLAQAFASIGRTDKALSVLERLVEELGATGQADKADAILNHARYWRPSDPGFMHSLKRMVVPRPTPSAHADAPPREAAPEGTVVLSIADLVVDEGSLRTGGSSAPAEGVELTEAEGTLTLRIADLILDEMQQAAGRGVAPTRPPGSSRPSRPSRPPPPPPPGALPRAPSAKKVHAGESTISLDAGDLLEALMITGSSEEAAPGSDAPTQPDRDSAVQTFDDRPTLPPPGAGLPASTPLASSAGPPAGALGPDDDDNPQATTAFYLPFVRGEVREDAPTVPPPGSSPAAQGTTGSISELIYDEDDGDDPSDDDSEPATLLHMKPLTAEDITRAQQGLPLRPPESTPARDPAPPSPAPSDSSTGLDAPTAFFVPQRLDDSGAPAPAPASASAPSPRVDSLTRNPRPELGRSLDEPTLGPRLGRPGDHEVTLAPRSGPHDGHNEPTLGHRAGPHDDLEATLASSSSSAGEPSDEPAGEPSVELAGEPADGRMGDDAPTLARLKPLTAADIANALAKLDGESTRTGDTSVRPPPADDPAPADGPPPPLPVEPPHPDAPPLLSSEPPHLDAPPLLSNEPPHPDAPPLLSSEDPSLDRSGTGPSPAARPAAVLGADLIAGTDPGITAETTAPRPAAGNDPGITAETTAPRPAAGNDPGTTAETTAPRLAAGNDPGTTAETTAPRLAAGASPGLDEDEGEEEMTVLNLTPLTPEDLARARKTPTDDDPDPQ